jgi:glycosyltransferase involved in cell wall biosynthesis
MTEHSATDQRAFNNAMGDSPTLNAQTTRPRVSVITVCFNSAACIADALRSVDCQTLDAREHVVVDGGSTDDTLLILARHVHPTRRWLSERDRGIYDAMNKGLELACGEVIGFLNSDDFYPRPDVLERVDEAFRDPDVDAVYGDLCYVRQDDPKVIVRYWRSCSFTPGLFAKAWCPPHPTLFIRRTTYRRLGGYDLRFPIAADMELMARYLEVHRVPARHIDKVLVHMRMGGTTNRSLKNILQQNREIWRALGQHGLERSLPGFVLRKLTARFQQYTSRPAA